MQYGGIRRSPNKYSYYTLHCTGDDGTIVRQGATVATNTAPQAKLAAVSEFVITRESFNKVSIRVSAPITGAIYSVSINGVQYSFTSVSDDELSIIEGLSKAVNPDGYKVSVNESNITLDVISESASRSGILVLSDNLTTASVTTLADFATIDYGKLIFPNGTITIMITNISGFNAVENLIAPTYGRLQETDVELRHSYLAKSAIRSTRMIDSICSQLINNVPNVESATGYENNTDDTDEEGRPPHSVEIIVDGGDETSIASIILDKKAAGIQTFGSITVDVYKRQVYSEEDEEDIVKYGKLDTSQFSELELRMYILIKAKLASMFELKEYYTLDEALKLYALYRMDMDIQNGKAEEMRERRE